MPPQIPQIPYIPGQNEPDDFYELQRRYRNRRLFPIGDIGTTAPPNPQSTVIPGENTVPPFMAERRGIEEAYKLLNQIPQRSDPQYTPSKWRMLGATVIGAGQGGEAGRRFRDEPYLEAMADWQSKWGPTKDVATLERYANAVNRQSTNDLQDYLVGRERNSIRAQEAITRMNRKPNAIKFIDRETGRIGLIDPATGDVEITSATPQDLTPEERRINRLEEIMTREQAQDRREEMRQAGMSERDRQKAQDAKDLENLRLKNKVAFRQEVAKTLGRVQIEQQSQRKIRFMNNAVDYINANPADKDWFDFDDADTEGYPRLKSVEEMASASNLLNKYSGGRFGTGQNTEAASAKRQAIYDAVFGDTRNQPLSTPAPNQGATQPQGEMIILGPNNELRVIPRGTPIPPGWKEAK